MYPYRSGYEFDWHYILSQLVVYFLANKFTPLLDSKTSIQKEFNIPDEDDNEIYSIYVSNDGEDWIKIYDLLLGYDVVTTNSFSYNNAMNGILFFRFVRFSV
jgi:hypothetical protein